MLFPCRKYVAKVTEEREREREREAEIPPEYQDCRCRRTALRSTLSAQLQQGFYLFIYLFIYSLPWYNTGYTSQTLPLNAFKCQGSFLFPSLFARVSQPKNSAGCNSSLGFLPPSAPNPLPHLCSPYQLSFLSPSLPPCLNIDRLSPFLSPSLSLSRSSTSVSVSLHPCTPVSSLILALSVKTPNLLHRHCHN